MPRTLVIGYGNRDRGDDGVAFEVVNGVRRCLGCQPLGEDETGFDRLGRTDAVFIPQLAPEWLDEVARYEQVIFVDAHSAQGADALLCSPVEPAYCAATFTHHLTPAMFLALLQMLCGSRPVGWIVSVQGYRFEFGRGLSDGTAALVQPAVERIVGLVDVARSDEQPPLAPCHSPPPCAERKQHQEGRYPV